MAGRSDLEPAPLAPPPQAVTLGASAGMLQASAQRLDPGVAKGESSLQPESRDHTQAWEDYKLPEVQKMVTSSAGLLSSCRLFVGVVDERGNEQPLRGEDGTPLEGFTEEFVADAEATLARFVDRNGSQRGLLRTICECWEVAGEAYLVGWTIDADGRPVEAGDTEAMGERWEALSRSGINKASGRWVIQMEPGTQLRLPETAVAYRMWISHPRYPGLPRSWVMAAAEPCMDLRVFTRAQRAAGRSGTIADLLLAPSEASPRQTPALPPMQPGAPKPAGATDAEGAQVMGQSAAFATFLERIIGDAVLEVMRDAQAGRTVIPPVVTMAEKYVDKVKRVSLARNVDTGLHELVEQARKRIADTADAETEFLFGLGDTNRWNGAQIDDTEYRRSFRPKALAIADSWTQELLWGGLRGLGYSAEDYTRVRVLVDPRGVVAEPDRGKAATEGLKLGAIGWASWREANGFSDDDAPTDEEQQRLLDAFGRTRQGTRDGNSTPPDDVGDVNDGAAAAPDATVADLAAEEPAPPARQAAAGRRPKMAKLAGRADTPTADPMDELLLIEQVARARLEEAAESALDAQLNRAGSKLRNWTRRQASASGETDLLARVANVDTREVPGLLGPERALALAAGQYESDEARREDLFAAALATLVASFGRITEDVYRRAAKVLGITFVAAEVDQNQGSGEAVLVASMLTWADRVVFNPVKPLDLGERTSLRVPTTILRRAAAAAGGAAVGAGLDPTVDAAGGFVFGPTVLGAAETAAAAEGRELKRIGWEWVYGDEPRMAPWPPHLSLAGQHLSGPSDPILAGKAPTGGYAYPGDHFGCKCDWKPVVEDTAAD